MDAGAHHMAPKVKKKFDFFQKNQARLPGTVTELACGGYPAMHRGKGR